MANDSKRIAKTGLTNPCDHFGHACRPSNCKRRSMELFKTSRNKRLKPEPPAPPEDNGSTFLVVATCDQQPETFAIFATNKVKTPPDVSIYLCIPHCDALHIAQQMRKDRNGWFHVDDPADFMTSFTAASRELRGEEGYHS